MGMLGSVVKKVKYGLPGGRSRLFGDIGKLKRQGQGARWALAHELGMRSINKRFGRSLSRIAASISMPGGI